MNCTASITDGSGWDRCGRDATACDLTTLEPRCDDHFEGGFRPARATEKVAIELVDGPFKGRTIFELPWPPPDILAVDEGEGAGTYVKVSQSIIPEPHPNLVRGAQYRWEGKA